MRLIDADALYNRFWERAWYDNADRDECACADIDNAPTIDAVPVVRCKDCVNGDADRGFFLCCSTGLTVNEDGFCSYGERKN